LSTKVYTKLLQVPEGKVTTYGDLAKAVGLKNGQRVIGTIMKNNPFPVIIPCHRVVRSDGKIGGYTYGEMVKFKMLTKEGIKIKDGKIIDFDKEKYPHLADDEKVIIIDALLDSAIRPALANDGGGLEVIEVEGHIVRIRYQGACGGCPSATGGTLRTIENHLRSQLDPEIKVHTYL